MALVTISEYARIHGINEKSLRQKIYRGRMKTAQKIEDHWYMDSDEPYTDLRMKTGKCRDWRIKKEKLKSLGVYNLGEYGVMDLANLIAFLVKESDFLNYRKVSEELEETLCDSYALDAQKFRIVEDCVHMALHPDWVLEGRYDEVVKRWFSEKSKKPKKEKKIDIVQDAILP